MKKLTKRQIKLIAWLLTIVIVTVTLTTVFILNSRGVEDFSEEQHIARISKRIQKNYINDETGYTDFKVYPLYNENEEVVLYMVEFEPKGFVYIKAENVNNFLLKNISGRTRYKLSSTSFMTCFYRIIDNKTNDNGNVTPYYHNGQCGIQDGNDWNFCGISPFILANVQNERRYIFHISDNEILFDYYIIAVKQGDEFLNVVTNEVFMRNDGDIFPKQNVCVFVYFYAVREFDLT